MKISDEIYGNIYTNVVPAELDTLNELAENKNIGVEIGSYLGASSYAISASNIKKLYCIDIWKSNTKLRPDPKSGKTLLETFKNNTKKYEDKIEIIVDYSYNAIKFFIKNEIKIDFLFIDGDHSYEGVKKDWELYKPIMQKDSIVVFHDWGWGSVKKMIKENVINQTYNHKNLPNMWWANIK